MYASLGLNESRINNRDHGNRLIAYILSRMLDWISTNSTSFIISDQRACVCVIFSHWSRWIHLITMSCINIVYKWWNSPTNANSDLPMYHSFILIICIFEKLEHNWGKIRLYRHGLIFFIDYNIFLWWPKHIWIYQINLIHYIDLLTACFHSHTNPVLLLSVLPFLNKIVLCHTTTWCCMRCHIPNIVILRNF